MAAREEALLALLRHLRDRHYHFVTPTPATHARVLARPGRREARRLSDIFGWSLPFHADHIDNALLAMMEQADILQPADDGQWRSRLRVSTLAGQLYWHSAYPTNAEDAVFFGPDSYRFARLIVRELRDCPQREGATIVDIGTGAGVGAIVAAGMCPTAALVMTDINQKALDLAAVNARAAGVEARGLLSERLDDVRGAIDVALANPPYIIDDAGRAYRDGGGMHGGEVALDMARMALPRLAPGGRFILYTGSAIVEGEDALGSALEDLAREQGCRVRYEEIDPDVFGGELEKPAYRDVDRIALVSAVLSRP